jgi:hypothetical protein
MLGFSVAVKENGIPSLLMISQDLGNSSFSGIASFWSGP